MAHDEVPSTRRRDVHRSTTLRPETQAAPEYADDGAVDQTDLDRREARQGPRRKAAGPPKAATAQREQLGTVEESVDARHTPDVAPTDPA
ncbi:MAG: hypothetical protein ACR2FV_04545 [Ornithinimicrobium sp.]|uniref:hypothetical protein n=1 Tax=Ornithinimicrobium sp. TaxID=1977084 RepID=UPI003D9BAADA